MRFEEHPEDLRNKIISHMYYRGRKVDDQENKFNWSQLKRKNVFIVLDDASSESQVSIMTESDGFSDESRVLVTSRDQGFLIPANFGCHFAEQLDDEDARRLFCLHAFRTAKAPSDYKHRVSQIILKCDGLPLALKVAGRYLYNRKKGELWDDALKKLRKAQPLNGSKTDGLWSILEVSYDSLAETEQEMFLDIAVCFHGQELESTKRAWRVCCWASADSGWENLLDKGLVMTYIRGNEKLIRMHETLRDLGRKRAGGSRVRIDIQNRPDFFRRYQASAAVKVLKIVCNPPRCESWHGTSVICAFGESQIRWMEVERAEIKSEDLNGLAEQVNGVSHLELKNCYSLYSLPESFGQVKTLCHLRFEDCGLFTLPESFGQLKALSRLEFVNCHHLRKLPNSFRQLKTLSHLEFVNCKRLLGTLRRSEVEQFRAESSPAWMNWHIMIKRHESDSPHQTSSSLKFVYSHGLLTVPQTFLEILQLGSLSRQVFRHCDTFGQTLDPHSD